MCAPFSTSTEAAAGPEHRSHYTRAQISSCFGLDRLIRRWDPREGGEDIRPMHEDESEAGDEVSCFAILMWGPLKLDHQNATLPSKVG